MKKQRHLDVNWYLSNRKKPFAYSTVATAILINALAEKYSIVQEVYNHYTFSDEGKELLKVLIDKGYGKIQIDANST